MKIVISWVHAATWPTCHETILFATFAPCWHDTKIIKKSIFFTSKSIFWETQCTSDHQNIHILDLKVDTLGAAVHIWASWNATMPIPSCQEGKMPAFLVPGAKILGLQVLGTWQYGVIRLRARGHLGDLVGFSPFVGKTQNHQKS